ncbi:MAG: response regulator [Balneolaceae bacterium]|nr:MAG: response regulator [Balneolaceae bacterium]
MVKTNHILLIEDNPDDILLTKRALEKIDGSIHVDVCESGLDAMEYLFHSTSGGRPKPDLIVLDLNLPKISGFDVLKKIRSHETTRALPVVVLSSSREESDLRRATEYGANSFIRKPVDFVKFREVADLIARYWLELNETMKA